MATEHAGVPAAYYTAEQVAEMFQIHPETVRANVRAGKWPHIKLGPRTTRFTQAHIDQIVALFEQVPRAESEGGQRGSRRRRTTS